MRNFFAAGLALIAMTGAAGAEQLPLNPDVTPATIGETICMTGWTKTVRPPVTYSYRVKQHLMRAEGLPLVLIGDKILDHRIPLELGGSPDSMANFILQDADESHGKDRVEHCLKHAVCVGSIPLSAAQDAIWRDWRSAAGLCGR